jgi:hypothetical protein
MASAAAATTKDNTNGAATQPEPPSFYDDEENLKKLCNFLRSGEGPPCRQAILMDKRVLYLKGEDDTNNDYC